MNSRDRVYTALNHQKPDRTPTDLQAVPEIWTQLRNHFSADNNDDVIDALEIDCVWVAPAFCGPLPQQFDDGTFEGWGGSRLRKVNNQFGAYDEVAHYASQGAESEEEIDALLKLPNIDDYDFSVIPNQIKRHADKFILSGFASTLYYPTLVRSMEDIFIDMASEPQLAAYLFKRCADWHLEYHTRLMEAGEGRIDAMQSADDFSTQLDLLMSVDMFKTYFKKNMSDFVKLTKAYKAVPFLHCCGSAYRLIDEFIDIGFEILDPVQTTAKNMEPERLKREFGEKLTFHGAVNTQAILPNGSPDDVRRNCKELIDTLGENGGYILTACHYLQADVPLDNVLAMYDLSIR